MDLKIKLDVLSVDEDALIFKNPSFDNSIIGVTFDGRVVYSLERMIKEFAEENECEEIEALEFIEYNTIRSLPYEEMSPVIVTLLSDLE